MYLLLLLKVTMTMSAVKLKCQHTKSIASSPNIRRIFYLLEGRLTSYYSRPWHVRLFNYVIMICLTHYGQYTVGRDKGIGKLLVKALHMPTMTI